MKPAASRPRRESLPTDRERKLAKFYAANNTSLQRVVARNVHATTVTIEDAVASAWATLLARPDIRLDNNGLRWLTTVAIREGWRLASTARELPAGPFAPAGAVEPEPGTLAEPEGDAANPTDLAVNRDEHTRRVAALGELKPRERRELYLHALGYSYHEIADLTDSTYTAVNRRITEGRAKLRRLAAENGAPPPR